MNLLFVDLLCPKGHIDINKFYLNIIKELDCINYFDLVIRDDYLDESSIKKASNLYLLPDNLFDYNNSIDYRFNNIKKIMWIFNNVKLSLYDVILISSYETISFSLAWRKEIKARTLVFNHNNINELDSKIKKFFFKRINSTVEHIVYEEFISDYLKNLGINNKVWINHHPLDFSKLEFATKKLLNKTKNNKFLVFAPSSSNDDNIIKQLINFENRMDVLDDNIKIVIKSNEIEYEDNQLVVSNKRLPYKEYIKKFYNANIITLFFDKEFQYRVSGVFFDSLVFKKRILVTNNVFSDYYLNKYNKLGNKFNTIQQFLKLLNKYYYGHFNNNDNPYIKEVYKIYSKDNIKKEMVHLLKSKGGER